MKRVWKVRRQEHSCVVFDTLQKEVLRGIYHRTSSDKALRRLKGLRTFQIAFVYVSGLGRFSCLLGVCTGKRQTGPKVSGVTCLLRHTHPRMRLPTPG